ncbi:heterokaryon incompatibility protein-domain-containing protein, partial [Amylocarpus encephaloides]
MRLINAKTYALEEFWDEHAEKYAILSHRWEDGEVSLQDIESPTALSVIQKKGLGKIKWSCKQALKDGLQYVWVDTCCIDKKSSAELSEAINSMFRWYKASTVCYGFLSDVDSSSSFRNMERQIRLSKWFTRGWTLQELIAPQDVVFYDQQWKQLGTKHSMRKLLSEVTAIDEEILDGSVPITNYSIAQRMSWIAGRTTTCVEDTAYCLLGIFDVNMPMLYGEGEKAFSRLQQEIIKHSDDQTILAWPINRPNQPSLFADHPQAFASCRYIVAAPAMKGGSPYSLTNRGMSIRLMAAPYTTGIYVARLNCFNLEMSAGGLPPSFRLGIFLKRLNEDDQYARVEQEGR